MKHTKTYGEHDAAAMHDVPPPPTTPIDPVYLEAADRIRKSPIWLHHNGEVMENDFYGIKGRPTGKTVIAAIIPGTAYAFSFILDDEKQAREIETLRDAIAEAELVEPMRISGEYRGRGSIARPFSVSASERDKAFAAMERGDGSAWDALRAKEQQAAVSEHGFARAA